MALVATLLVTLPSLAQERVRHKLTADVVVVRHPGVPAYQEIFDELSERCRLSLRVIPIDAATGGTLDERIGSARVLVTLGQDALDATSQRTEQKLAVLAAYGGGDGVIAAPTTGTPAEVLRAIKIALPGVRSIGVVAGPRQDAWLQRVVEAARRSGVNIVQARALDGPTALRALLRISSAIDAIWLPADPDVVSVQVFRYALQLQQEKRLALIAATRQQVHSGALLAIDFPPRALGRAAADVINRWVEHPWQEPVFPTLGTTLTVNRRAALQLSVDLPSLVAIGARIE